MKADLHVHSTASDGTLTPTQLVELAISSGVDVLAISDHDSVEGIPEAIEAASAHSLTLIPAVELSSVCESGADAHILGFGIDPNDDELRSHLSDLRAARLMRARTMTEALADAGYGVSLEEVLALSDGGAVGRSHVARALVNAGHATDVADAFRRLIGHGRPFYVGKDVRTPAEALAIIEAAGGVAVVAHPGVNRVDCVIEEFAGRGLRGIEAYHADHSDADRHRYERLAEQMGLLVTGGTDYHGPQAPNPPLGSVDIPERHVHALLSACGIA